MTPETLSPPAPAGVDADPAWIAAHPRVQRVPNKDLALFILRDFLSAGECMGLIDRIDAQLGRFQGRIRRDDWVGQASLLAAGDDSGFAQRYGKLS